MQFCDHPHLVNVAHNKKQEIILLVVEINEMMVAKLEEKLYHYLNVYTSQLLDNKHSVRIFKEVKPFELM